MLAYPWNRLNINQVLERTFVSGTSLEFEALKEAETALCRLPIKFNLDYYFQSPKIYFGNFLLSLTIRWDGKDSDIFVHMEKLANLMIREPKYRGVICPDEVSQTLEITIIRDNILEIFQVILAYTEQLAP